MGWNFTICLLFLYRSERPTAQLTFTHLTSEERRARPERPVRTHARPIKTLPFLYLFFTGNRFGGSGFPILDLFMEFGGRNFVYGNAELERAGGLLDLATQVAGSAHELRRG